MRKILGCISSLILMSFAQAKTVYIAPNGDDANDGLSDTASVKTLADAYAKANEAGDTIQFLDGTYTFANFPETTVVTRGITFAGNPSDRTAVTLDMTESEIAYVIEQSGAIADPALVIKDLSYCNSAKPALVWLAQALTNFELTNCVLRDSTARTLSMGLPGGTENSYKFTEVLFENLSAAEGAVLFGFSGQAAGGSVFAFDGCTFKNCGQSTQQNGGVIYSRITPVSWRFSNCTVSGCYASASNGKGGFLFSSQTPKIEVTGSVFSNNWSTAGAGVFHVDGTGSTVTMSDCVFLENKSLTGNGGAYHASRSGITNSFVNCTFDSCSGKQGGALSASTLPMLLTISNCTFRSCRGHEGAALYGKGDIRVYDTAFVDNSTTNRAGAVRLPEQTTQPNYRIEFVNCGFTNNVTTGYSGALDAMGGDLSMSRCVFKDCVGKNGAAMFIGGYGDRLFDGCVFEACSGTGSGAIQMNPSGGDYCRFVDCLFSKCVSPDYGAVLRTQNGNIVEVLFDRCRIVGNCAKKAIVSKSGCINATTPVRYQHFVFRNSVFEGNRVTDTGTQNIGQVLCMNGEPKASDHSTCATLIENCTFTRNKVGKGAVIGAENDCDGFVVRNSIFWNNEQTVTGSSGVNFACDLASFYTFENNISDQDIAAYGTGNTMADPLFTHAGTWSEDGATYNFDGNYTLTKRSPARDAGARLSWMTADATDIAGNARVFGSAPDLGAYEYKSISGLILIFK